jgi:hypothetical protein
MLLNYRVYTIVPNISWGIGLHECDMLALDNKGRFTEIEIKVTASDLKADFKKKHSHSSKMISRLFYAMPIELCEKYDEIIPKHCGIISVHGISVSHGIRYFAKFYRHAKHDKKKENPNEKIIKKFMQLGCMRIWSLKSHNYYKTIK